MLKTPAGQTLTKLTQTTTLSLKAGDYVVTAPTFTVGGPTKPVWKAYSPDAPSKQVRVQESSGTASVTFTYDVEDLKTSP